MQKKVILLNGASSSGKSTLSHALQNFLQLERNEEYGVISIDDFLDMSTGETIYEDDVFDISSKLSDEAIHILNTKQGIIIDHVITSERIFKQIVEALNFCDIYLIQVTCPLSELVRREKARNNRCLGSAESSYQYLYPKEAYDLTVDTFMLSAKECTIRINDVLNDKPRMKNN